MMPLWMMAMLPEQSRCGWALIASGAPCVAQRVWPMPEVNPFGAARHSFLSAVTDSVPEAVRARQVSPARTRAMPAES